MEIDEILANARTIKSKRHTVEITVTIDGCVLIRAPLKMSDERITEFVKSKLPWIEKQLKKCGQRKAAAESQPPLTKEEIEKLCEKAKAELPGRVAHYAEIVGVSYGRITVRCMKTRWGSCSSRGDLSFNCLLMLIPEEVTDYIIVHELCHRKHMDHSRKFYDDVLLAMPDYKERNKWLTENGSAVMMRVYGAK